MDAQLAFLHVYYQQQIAVLSIPLFQRVVSPPDRAVVAREEVTCRPVLLALLVALRWSRIYLPTSSKAQECAGTCKQLR